MDVRLTPGVSSPVYAYGINLQPEERVTEDVMKLSAQLAQAVQETGTTFILDKLDQRFQALLQRLDDTGVSRRGEPLPPIIPKRQWLQAQLVTIQKLAKSEKV